MNATIARVVYARYESGCDKSGVAVFFWLNGVVSLACLLGADRTRWPRQV
jgi:hypothetical protein